MGRRSGVPALVEWSLAFATLTLVVISAIGIFLIPVAIAALVAAGVRNRVWPYLPLGVLTGVGVLATAIGLLHLVDFRCRSASSGCSSLDARWLTVGGSLAVIGVVGYIALTRGERARRTS